MKTLFAFYKKEQLEWFRSGRLILLLAIFMVFGIMNPVFAKITPWLMEMMASSLADAGLSVSRIEVDAMTSWTQFYKNAPMVLLVFVIIISNLFTKEYQSGSLILVLTKGLSRVKVVLAKSLTLLLIWSVCFWLYYGITYGYNAFYWDNSIASCPAFAALCYWLFGVWIVSLVVLFSSIASGNTLVLAGTGGVFGLLYLLGIFPRLAEYLPLQLSSGFTLLTGEAAPSDFTAAIAVTLIFSLGCITGGIAAFNRRKL